MEQKIVDIDFLQKSASNREMLHLQIKSFINFASSHVELLEESLEHEDWTEVEKAAQALIPKMKDMGMNQLISQLEEISNKAAEKDVDADQMDSLVTSIVDACKQGLAELRAIIK